jgi:hypothetical protein
VKATSGRCQDDGFGLTTVRDDPPLHLVRANPFGDDRSPLDNRATRGVGSCQPIEQKAYRVVVHVTQR